MSRTWPCHDEYVAEGDNPVLTKCRAKRFTSRSKGWRNGKRRIRKVEKDVILLQYGNTGWKSWDGSDHNCGGRVPFDQWATEIFGLPFCEGLAEHPDDYLRGEIREQLRIGGVNSERRFIWN